MPSTLNYARALVLFDRVIKAELEMNSHISSRGDARQGENVGRKWVERRTFKRRWHCMIA
jgi:hypothetical protein